MLTHLTIQNVALIETLSLDFSAGLIIFTGETGAGKSIILDALSLALGKRFETVFLREGADKCEVLAVFDITQHPLAQRWLEQNELSNEDECIVRRIVSHDGRSKSFINNRLVPLQSLRELGWFLVTLHGQHDQQHLLQSDGQRQLLDQFGKLTPLVQEVKQRYQQLRDAQKQIEEKRVTHQQLRDQQDFLLFQKNELADLHLKTGEFEELEKEQKRAAHHQHTVEGIQHILRILDEDEHAISSHLQSINHTLSQLAEYDETLTSIHTLIDTAHIQIKESISELQHHLNKTEFDPARLNEIDRRLSLICELARKHRCHPTELPTFLTQLLEKLKSIENDASEITQLEEKIKILLLNYHEKAHLLSQKRKVAATQLNQTMTDFMQTLGMKGGKFEVRFDTDDKNPSPFGFEKIEFWVLSNPGAAFQPLAKIASGGELSRLSLAMTVMTVSDEAKMTLIFDEVDTGIGGTTATCVGELLKKLSQHHQLMCITHAAQVAAFSEQHFLVSKKISKNKTHIAIQKLNAQEKIQEIARMISGSTITASTLKHAKDLVESG